MSGLRTGFRGGGAAPGGIVSYPLERLLEEVAYLAFHFHWSYDEVLSMEHAERQQWVEQLAQINTRLNAPTGVNAPVEAGVPQEARDG